MRPLVHGQLLDQYTQLRLPVPCPLRFHCNKLQPLCRAKRLMELSLMLSSYAAVHDLSDEATHIAACWSEAVVEWMGNAVHWTT